jgi:UTP-glucose-1-phosphate uridylyltransferase/mevalonate kinase
MRIFVPGRICLFGEHTDWAGGYRRINGELEKGYTIIAGTNQGVHADVEPHPSKLVIHSTLEDGTSRGPFEVDMQLDALLDVAAQGGFFSYAAGVAHQVLTHYRVRGLTIDNYRTDLPIKKGLSSSAALCVLVARAFNRVYDLKMTTRGEMEYAYLGEITTPSRCGRMDQGCAYGNRPILMAFDGDRIDVQELNVPRELHFLIVDLQAGKDTREILKKLNQCYPFADDALQRKVQEYLGPISARITHQAAEALEAGDAAQVGALMREAQALFDEHLQPACPGQLTAPVLHKVLSYGPLQPHVLGGKGVGSQGDGSAQFVCADAETRARAIEIIEGELGMPCLELTLSPPRTVRKAVIPAAGFGTRLFPATKALKKEIFPVVGKDGVARPLILAIVEEALDAGIEEVAIIVQARDRALFEDLFFSPPAVENYNKLPREGRDYCDRILEIGHRITLIEQDVQEGFGHAVFCGRDWVGEEPFLLMLGDHLYESDTDVPCARQVVDLYNEVRQSVVGLAPTPGDLVHRFGCVAGQWQDGGSVLSVSQIVEKPELHFAREHLRIEGLGEDEFLGLFGLYVLTPAVFGFLEESITRNLRERGEFQLTSCLDRLRQEEGMTGYVVRGRRFDMGSPDGYRRALADYGARGR